MNRATLIAQIYQKHSYLCVGLDTDIQKIPKHLHQEKDPIFAFNRQIIDATIDYCVAYKINIAFYESLGARGWESLEKTLAYIPNSVFTIADAKRGDIGNTSSLYAKAFFENMNFDSITVAPYMGQDSVSPFLTYPDKWVILLALTSNEGSRDFQMLKVQESAQDVEEFLFEKVLKISQLWGGEDQLMYVVGATHPQLFEKIRQLVPNHFLLVPGYGAQGGDLQALSKAGMNQDCGLLVNSSRGIIYASADKDFAQVAQKISKGIAEEMKIYLGQ
ncbi:MAG: orotidine-5'-phosphate decarboxylase [Thermoflexibacter sp.]|jgi:orotidine-5'-phosphate decarboxylase|nr:orotidine-5'-phosphate decarboxylase [Thermoflexibacter sp.]